MKSIEPLNICIQALNDLKAQNLLTLDISESSNFSDWFVITQRWIAGGEVQVLRQS